jgi:succinate dehydrogenase / fumarate reductase flavoprotein subunit
MGYQVTCFCFQDTARRAHSVAAQGGVNACKNYKNDGDTVFRMFYDTIKGGDFRSREANVYRLAECSAQLIDQAVAQGVPFAREYSGYLSNRSFGGVQVSRTFYARGQTGQQLLLGAYQALMRQVAAGRVRLFTRHEMLDLVNIEGKARGIIVRNMDTGALERHGAHAVVLATGGFGKIYYLSTLAMGCNASAIWRADVRIAAKRWANLGAEEEGRGATGERHSGIRKGLLPGTSLSGLWQLVPTRYCLAGGQGKDRRRLWSRAAQECRLSGFFQSHERTREG